MRPDGQHQVSVLRKPGIDCCFFVFQNSFHGSFGLQGTTQTLCPIHKALIIKQLQIKKSKYDLLWRSLIIAKLPECRFSWQYR